MKTDLTLNALAAELTRQTESRKDYLAPQSKITATVSTEFHHANLERPPQVVLEGINGPLPLTPYAHGQLSDHLGIPKKYYDRMHAEQPELLARNITTWLHADGANKRMIRTLDGKVRGFLSPKFRPLDNFDLTKTVLPVLFDKGAEIVSASLTETRLYIKAILPSLSDELPEGLSWGHGHAGVDRGKVVSGIVISNSDIGAGTLRVEPSVWTTFCTNLAILMAAAMKKYHAGRANQSDDSFEVFSDETRRADDAAFWLKVRDITNAAFDETQFRKAVEQLKLAGGREIKGELPAVVEAVVEQLSLSPALSPNILTYLAKGGDLTQWGLSSAITRVAGDVESYEEATQLERAGGAIITLAPDQWTVISEAAAA